MLKASGKPQDAIQEYIKLAEAYYNLADLNTAHTTYSNAFRFAQQSKVDRGTKVKLLHRMADIDMQSFDWRSAVRVFEQIRTLEPDDAKARDMLFELNIRLGQEKQAMAELDNYINHLISLHRTAEVIEYLNVKIVENQALPGLYRRLAEIYRLLDRGEDAVSQLEIAKDLYLQAGNRTAAIETLMLILALNPVNVKFYQRMLVELQAEEQKGK
jgi:tetratricopeptide (TPR) repeat protein